jgi:hypothetical protein
MRIQKLSNVWKLSKELNIIAFNHNSLKKMLYDKVWRFDIKNIYPKYQRFNTDIDPTVDFVFPVPEITQFYIIQSKLQQLKKTHQC